MEKLVAQEKSIGVADKNAWSTGFVYDGRCDKHACAQDPDHKERPARTQRIRQDMEKSGLLLRCLEIADVRPVNDYHLKRVHNLFSAAYVAAAADVGKPMWIDEDTYVSGHSMECARLACGGLLALCDHVMTDRVSNGFAAIRPPGHHADANSIRGFCIFNNVAVAAEHLRKQYPDLVKRVMIVDWDVHHGDGTEEIFWDRSDVLYLSIHRYDNGDFYPRSGHAKSVGGPNAQGMNINIPYNGMGHGDAEYLLAWRKVVVPIATAYKPDVILVSAGFDCAQNDPLGRQNVSPECFAHLTRQLMHIPSGTITAPPPQLANAEKAAESSKAAAAELDQGGSSQGKSAPIAHNRPKQFTSDTTHGGDGKSVALGGDGKSAALGGDGKSVALGVARVIMALEGGYNLDSLGASATACVRSLLGDPLPELKGGADTPDAYVNPKFVESLRQVILMHQNFWPEGTLSNIPDQDELPTPKKAQDIALQLQMSTPLDPTQKDKDPVLRDAAQLHKSLETLHL